MKKETKGLSSFCNCCEEILKSILFRAGVQAFAEALLIIVKVLAQNSGLDPQEAIVKLQQEYLGMDQPVGLDIKTGEQKKS